MSSDERTPTLPLPVIARPEPVKRRRRWLWPVVIGSVLLLAIAAWFIGEAIAKPLVSERIRAKIVDELSLASDQELTVTVPGLVLPQLIAGTLNEVAVSSADVDLGPLSGDVTVRAAGVPIRGDVSADSITASIVLDDAQLLALVEDQVTLPVPIESLEFDGDNVVASAELDVIVSQVPVSLALTPGAADGDVILRPTSVSVAGVAVPLDVVTEQFGPVAGTIIRDWSFCIAEYVPAAATLADLRVEGDRLVADFDVDGAIISDPTLQENGSCTA